MKGKRTVTACVTNLSNCEQIILNAKQIAEERNCKLHVLNIQKIGEITKTQCASIEYLHQVCKNAGAQMTVKYTDSAPAYTAIEFIKANKTDHLVTGIPAEGDNGFLSIISSILPKLKISMVSSANGRAYIFENIFLIKSISKQIVRKS